ncbi:MULTISPECIES: hypothetical protein [unclassified Methylobacterium]|uniref:hypothetical protein n=1 Tax=unclassified Methylobacterium TaxID=2615210 RepID=UPI00226A3B63|nr:MULTISPECIES: hypothetical protein [unclassified Methylobacterium]
MTDDEPKRNKGGRPAKYPGEGRRPTLSLRVRGSLYDQLKKAAEASERTISEEMEYRLAISFVTDDTAKSAAAAARQAIDEAQDAYAVQAIHSTLEELQEDLGHPWSLAVAFHMGQSFTEYYRLMKMNTADELWFDNPNNMKGAASYMHNAVDNLFANWSLINYRVSLWGLLQKYMANILRKKADGTYVRREAEDQARRKTEEQVEHEA